MGNELCSTEPLNCDKPLTSNERLTVVGEWNDHDTRIIVTLLKFFDQNYNLRSFDEDLDKEVNPGKQIPMIISPNKIRLIGNLTNLIRYLIDNDKECVEGDQKRQETIDMLLKYYEFKMRPITGTILKGHLHED